MQPRSANVMTPRPAKHQQAAMKATPLTAATSPGSFPSYTPKKISFSTQNVNSSAHQGMAMGSDARHPQQFPCMAPVLPGAGGCMSPMMFMVPVNHGSGYGFEVAHPLYHRGNSIEDNQSQNETFESSIVYSVVIDTEGVSKQLFAAMQAVQNIFCQPASPSKRAGKDGSIDPPSFVLASAPYPRQSPEKTPEKIQPSAHASPLKVQEVLDVGKLKCETPQGSSKCMEELDITSKDLEKVNDLLRLLTLKDTWSSSDIDEIFELLNDESPADVRKIIETKRDSVSGAGEEEVTDPSKLPNRDGIHVYQLNKTAQNLVLQLLNEKESQADAEGKIDDAQTNNDVTSEEDNQAKDPNEEPEIDGIQVYELNKTTQSLDAMKDLLGWLNGKESWSTAELLKSLQADETAAEKTSSGTPQQSPIKSLNALSESPISNDSELMSVAHGLEVDPTTNDETVAKPCQGGEDSVGMVAEESDDVATDAKNGALAKDRESDMKAAVLHVLEDFNKELEIFGDAHRAIAKKDAGLETKDNEEFGDALDGADDKSPTRQQNDAANVASGELSKCSDVEGKDDASSVATSELKNRSDISGVAHWRRLNLTNRTDQGVFDDLILKKGLNADDTALGVVHENSDDQISEITNRLKLDPPEGDESTADMHYGGAPIGQSNGIAKEKGSFMMTMNGNLNPKAARTTIAYSASNGQDPDGDTMGLALGAELNSETKAELNARSAGLKVSTEAIVNDCIEQVGGNTDSAANHKNMDPPVCSERTLNRHQEGSRDELSKNTADDHTMLDNNLKLNNKVTGRIIWPKLSSGTLKLKMDPPDRSEIKALPLETGDDVVSDDIVTCAHNESVMDENIANESDESMSDENMLIKEALLVVRREVDPATKQVNHDGEADCETAVEEVDDIIPSALVAVASNGLEVEVQDKGLNTYTMNHTELVPIQSGCFEGGVCNVLSHGD